MPGLPRRKQVLVRRTQAERKQERKELGKLRHQVFSEKAEHRYFLHVSRFLDFLFPTATPELFCRWILRFHFLLKSSGNRVIAKDGLVTVLVD